MLNLWQDCRFALRQIAKAPGFALTTILTIGLGIGATTAIFSLVNTVLLRPLPFPHPDRLVAAGSVNDRRAASSGLGAISYPDFFDWRAQSHSFDGLAAFHDNGFTLTGRGDPKHLSGQIVTANFFSVLGVAPAMGRDVSLDDEKPGVHVVVLSHELWESSFASAGDIIGHAATLDNVSYTVIGVMPRGFVFPIQNPAPLLWTSSGDDAFDPGGDPMTGQRGAHLLEAVGRLRPGVSAEQAAADLSLIARHLSEAYPDTNRHFTGARVMTELEALVGDTRPALRILFAAVVLVLLIACANVAGLLLARGSRRRSEVAVRSAMGASRAQILRQMLVESLVLSVCGGLAGVGISALVLRVLVRLVPADLPRLDQVAVDGTVLAFAIAVSLVTGLLSGMLPAWRMARIDPATALRDGTRTASVGRGHHRVQNALVVAETAVGLVLLMGSGLLIRSFVHVLQVDPGFDQHNVLTATLAVPDNRYSRDQQIQFYRELLSKLGSLPGVVSESAAWPLPLGPFGVGITFDIEGHPLPPGEQNSAALSIVQPDYFRTMRIPLLHGREFSAADDTKANPVVIISQSLASKFFPGEDPVGKHINPGINDDVVKEVPREIIAVVGDVKTRRLTEDTAPHFYLPFAQAVIGPPSLVIRTAVDPASLIPAVRAQVAQMDKNLALFDVHTLDGVVSQSQAQQRFQAILLSCFAGMALLLSAIGLYGLLSYLVLQRTLEIGVRIALGAQRRDVLGMILGRGLMLAAGGLAIGIVASVALSRFIRGLLFGVQPLDVMTFVGVSAVLLLVSLIASSAPAYRAANLDPMKTLRDQ